ncbi:MAG: divalent metal cation transporter, partial [Flavobacteriales bacterium]|nr:divalent metal cation transporter [Flavobacteriales bacterium]
MLKKLKHIGPGAMVAAAFIGPGTITTATLAGASYGYTLLWAILFSVLATIVLQEMASRLGVIGRKGLGEAIRAKLNGKLSFYLAATLVISAIFIGNAAYESGNISGAVLGFKSILG